MFATTLLRGPLCFGMNFCSELLGVDYSANSPPWLRQDLCTEEDQNYPSLKEADGGKSRIMIWPPLRTGNSG